MLQTKSSRIEIRTDEEAKKLIEKAAGYAGTTISAYILSKSISSARKDIEEMETIFIGDKDTDMFYSLVTNPPAPNEALKKLFNTDLAKK